MKKLSPYLVFLAAMLWATDAPFRMELTKHLNSNFIVLAEHFVDVLFVLPILLHGYAKLKKLTLHNWLAVVLIGVGGSALASVAFTQAFRYVNPSVAILLQKLQPFVAISLAAGVLKEKLSFKYWEWAVIAIGGAYLISFPNLKPQLFPGEQFNPNIIGVGYALLAALLWGASTVFGKYVLASTDYKMMTGLRFAVAFLFLVILNALSHSIPVLSQVDLADWVFVVIISVTSGVVAIFVYYKGLENTSASVATIAELGFPMAAVIVNWIFLDATLVPVQLLGMLVLVFAIFRLTRL
ncbi:MAG TPA: DMT family transporter [Bacteroidota bacterium]|nr:DMT family transporter [Bacteroidota bacterium]